MVHTLSEQESKQKTLFETIYRLAKDKNEEGLKAITKSGVCINFAYGESNIVKLLAKQGNHEAVEFLIDKFKASRNSAAEGYARGGFVKFVNEQIELGAHRDYAVSGYALAGNIEQVDLQISKGANRNYAALCYACSGYIDQVNQQIAAGADKKFAAQGYAQGGHIEQVNQLLAASGNVLDANIIRNWAVRGYGCGGRFEQLNQLILEGANRDDAVFGLAHGNYIEQVNQQIQAGASRDFAVRGYASAGLVEQVNQQIAQGASRSDAVWAYATCGYIDQVNDLIAESANKYSAEQGYIKAGCLDNINEALRIAALTDNTELRRMLLTTACAKKMDHSFDSLCNEAAKLNQIMKECQFTFKQAKSLKTKGALTWLLLGQDVVKSNVCPADIYFAITSALLDLPIQDVKKVHSAANRNLFFKSIDNSVSKFKDGSYTFDQSIDAQKKAKEHYLKRIKF